jgi:hypothetical protein
MRALAVFAALSVVLLGVACGDENPIGHDTEGPDDQVDEAQPTPQPTSDPVVARAPVSYPASPEGLEQLISDILDSVDPTNEKKLAPLIESLRLRKYEQWFETRFDRAKGKLLADEYAPISADIGLIVKKLENLKQRNRTTISVQMFNRTGDEESVGYQSEALSRMITATPLYSVRLLDEKKEKAFHLWSFIHDGTSFRFVGKMRALSRPDYAGDTDMQELRLADAKRIKERPKK